MKGKIRYEFKAKMWLYPGQGGWHFVSLPKNLASEIRDHLNSEEQGWGRLTLTASIGDCEWKTAIWFDRKENTYLLPLKAEIRKRGNLKIDEKLKVVIWI